VKKYNSVSRRCSRAGSRPDRGADYVNLSKLAIRHADGIIQASQKINSKVKKAAEESGKPFMVANESEDFSDYGEFYDLLLEQA
jgi:starch synthase